MSIVEEIFKKHKELMQKRDVMLIDKNTASASKKEYEEAVEEFNQFLLDVEEERKQPKLPGIKNGIAEARHPGTQVGSLLFSNTYNIPTVK